MPLASRVLALLASLCAAAPLGALAAPRVINNCMAITDSGSYVVGRNLAAVGDCLVVQADFVTIDLDGFVISGNGTGAGVAELLSTPRRGITVRNGAITGFQGAIALAHSTGVTVERINATANAFDAIAAGDMATVTRSTVAGNGGTGIRLGQRATASANAVDENVGNGIFVDIGGNVAGNTVGRNHASGIVTTEGALVTNNVSRNNGANGIVVDCPSAVVANTTSNNGGDNLQLIGGACSVSDHNSTL